VNIPQKQQNKGNKEEFVSKTKIIFAFANSFLVTSRCNRITNY